MLQFTALLTMLRKELRRMLRIWPQTLLPPAITTFLYLIIFGHVIGQRIGGMDGVPYIQYIIPGLIILAIINHSCSASVASFFSAKFQRSIEELLVAPVWNVTILLGFMATGVMRGVVVGVIVAFITLFFSSITIHSIVEILLVGLLASLIFSLVGIINAIFARNFDDISIIPAFVLTPLTYLGGVFYSLQILPKLWQDISLANPIFYIVNAFRYGFLGNVSQHIAISYLAMIFCVVIFFIIALYLIAKGKGLRN